MDDYFFDDEIADAFLSEKVLNEFSEGLPEEIINILNSENLVEIIILYKRIGYSDDEIRRLFLEEYEDDPHEFDREFNIATKKMSNYLLN